MNWNLCRNKVSYLILLFQQFLRSHVLISGHPTKNTKCTTCRLHSSIPLSSSWYCRMIYSNPSSPNHDSSAPFSPTSPPEACPAMVADTEDPLLEVDILADGLVICQFSVTATSADAVNPCENVLCTCPAHSE